MDIDDFRAGQRRLWETGDYRQVATILEPAALRLVDAAGVEAGQQVLDVATGSGNVAVAAAATGAAVTGVDITDQWFPSARDRAASVGATVDLTVGDAEDLPFATDAFDVVTSGFGAIFAPRHDVVTAELVRVCRPGGTIAMTSWPRDGANWRIFAVLSADLPPLPDFVTPSWHWGEPDHVQRLFADHDVPVTVQRHALDIRFASVARFEAWLEHVGGYVTVRGVLRSQGLWDAAHDRLMDLVADANQADDDTLAMTWEYVLIVADVPA